MARGCHYVKSLHGSAPATLQHYLTYGSPEAAANAPPTGLVSPHKHLPYAPQLRVAHKRKEIGVLSMEQQSVRPGSVALNGDYIWDMITIPTCQFTDFELTDSRDAERLDRFAQTADEIIRIADRDSVRVRSIHFRSLCFLEKLIISSGSLARLLVNCRSECADMMGFSARADCGKNGETTVG